MINQYPTIDQVYCIGSDDGQFQSSHLIGQLGLCIVTLQIRIWNGTSWMSLSDHLEQEGLDSASLQQAENELQQQFSDDSCYQRSMTVL